MLAPLSPFDAYRTDLDRCVRRSDFGSADTVWLLLAHCLGRLGSVSEGVRTDLALQAADALRDLLDASDPAETPHVHDLRLIVAGLADIESRRGADAICRSIRGFAARMAEAGALSMAYAVLGNTRCLATQAGDRERGLLAADQARVARQLGELDSADELYRVASAVGERSSDQELVARASLGRGVLARVRGNYPRARMLFQNGLEMSVLAGERELEYFAHQGLTIIYGVARDFDQALSHGWAAFRLSYGDPTRETESLTNLAQVCLDAGYAQAALRAFMSALSRTSVLRVRLSAMAGAALAAGKAGNRPLLEKLALEITDTVSRSALPYDNADALRHLAAGVSAMGDEVGAERYRQQCLKIARAHGFHELEISCERAELARLAPAATSKALQNESRTVVSALEVFEPETDEAAFALIRSD
jgi:tetratricopeptide (TPR) repeat protein